MFRQLFSDASDQKNGQFQLYWCSLNWDVLFYQAELKEINNFYLTDTAATFQVKQYPKKVHSENQKLQG